MMINEIARAQCKTVEAPLVEEQTSIEINAVSEPVDSDLNAMVVEEVVAPVEVEETVEETVTENFTPESIATGTTLQEQDALKLVGFPSPKGVKTVFLSPELSPMPTTINWRFATTYCTNLI